jgi:hypothetical protein
LETVAQAQPPLRGGRAWRRKKKWPGRKGKEEGEAEEGEGRGTATCFLVLETEEGGLVGPTWLLPVPLTCQPNLLRFGRFIGIHGFAFIYFLDLL